MNLGGSQKAASRLIVSWLPFFRGKMIIKKGKWPVRDEKYKTRAFLVVIFREAAMFLPQAGGCRNDKTNKIQFPDK